MKDLQDLDDNLFKFLKKEKNEIINQFKELFIKNLNDKIIDNYNNMFDWASYPQWDDFWGEFEEEIEKIKMTKSEARLSSPRYTETSITSVKTLWP